jgi:hypothetical protein
LARRKENRRSLGFARDDKKERVVVGRGRLPDERVFVKGVILPPQNVSLSKAVLMRKGSEDDEVKAGTLHA